MSTFVYDLFIFAQIKCGKNFHELKGLTFLNHHLCQVLFTVLPIRIYVKTISKSNFSKVQNFNLLGAVCHWSPKGEDGCPPSKWPIGLVRAKIGFYVRCNRTHVAHKILHQDVHICKKWYSIKSSAVFGRPNIRPCHLNPKIQECYSVLFWNTWKMNLHKVNICIFCCRLCK